MESLEAAIIRASRRIASAPPRVDPFPIAVMSEREYVAWKLFETLCDRTRPGREMQEWD